MSVVNLSYQIILKLHKSIDIQIGKLGKFSFPKGEYIYTGSSRKNMDQRLKRHQRKNKKVHWHIDYLLAQQECNILKIMKSNMDECSLNQATNGLIISPGFGASDCSEGCISHLKFRG